MDKLGTVPISVKLEDLDMSPCLYYGTLGPRD